MNKGKIALIVTSVILALALAVAAVFIGLNWSKLKSAIVDKTQLYTYEQLEQAKKEGFDEAGLNKSAYEKQLKEFAQEVARLESEVNSLTNDKNAKIEEINELNLKISALSTKINFINDLLCGKDVSGYELTEELKSFQSKLNELLQEKFNQGFNAGYAEGLANGTVNVPQNSFALIFAPNVPSNCSSNIEGKMTSSVNSCSIALVIPNCDYSLKGYIFKGWNTKVDGTGTTYSAGATIAANSIESGATLILYAQWQLYSLAGRAYSVDSSSEEFVGIYFRNDSSAYYGKLRLEYGKLYLLQVNELNFDNISYLFKNDILSWTISNEVSTFSFNEETDCLSTGDKEFARVDGFNDVIEAPNAPRIRLEGDTLYISNLNIANYGSGEGSLFLSFICEGCDPMGFQISNLSSTSYVFSLSEFEGAKTLSGKTCEIYAHVFCHIGLGEYVDSACSNSVFYTFN